MVSILERIRQKSSSHIITASHINETLEGTHSRGDGVKGTTSEGFTEYTPENSPRSPHFTALTVFHRAHRGEMALTAVHRDKIHCGEKR